MAELPCIHRGDPTGATFDCGPSRGLQPVFACNHPALGGLPCAISMCSKREFSVEGRLRSCASCNFREASAGRKQVNERIFPAIAAKPAPGQDKFAMELRPDRPGDKVRRKAKRRRSAGRVRGADVTDEEPAGRVVPAFYGTITRNLAYYVYPFTGTFIWQRNVEQLLQRIDLFNGRRVVAIATGQGLDPPEKVIAAFAGHTVEFIDLPNNPAVGEVTAFVPMLDRLATTNNDEVTFYAHAKGVTRPINEGVTVHRWADVMYESCLDYWPRVEKLLDQLPIAGSFKKVGHGFQGSKSMFHYSGTFFWLRHCGVFNRDWRQVDQIWGGVEAWPGVHFRPEEGGCIFRRGTVPALNLYDMSYFTDSVMPHYRQWQREHSHERTQPLVQGTG